MSPLLFNLGINDLVTEINNLDIHLHINGRKMSMLLYANDIILIANGARDLQRMLNMLDNWCKWCGLCKPPQS